MKHNPETIKKTIAKCSIEDLKKIATACGKNHPAVLNVEALRLLEEQLSAEDYSEFYNNLKD